MKYSEIPISRTSRGNTNWFKKSGVREIESGIKLRLIGRVLCDLKKYILFNVDLDLYSQTKRTVLKKQKRNITEHMLSTVCI